MSAHLPRITWNAGTLSLVVANMVPLFGALFFDWSLSSVIFLYWTENVVIGIFNIARMNRAIGPLGPGSQHFKVNGKLYAPDMKGKLIFFYLMHYGLFTFVHSIFISVLFGRPEDLDALSFLIALVSLFVSHGISYQKNFIEKKEYERLSAPDLFFHPYKRVIILHITILFGGLLAQIVGFPVIAAVLLIFLKTGVDVFVHSWEHQKFASSQLVISAI